MIPTIAEQKPEKVYTQIFTLSTLIPDRPTDNTCHPNGVFFNKMPAITAIIARMITPTGIPVPPRFRPKNSNPVFPSPSFPASSENVAPSDLKFAKPLQIYIVPRVAINGATLNFVMTIPLIAPRSAPMIAVMITTIGTLKYSVTPNIFKVSPC